MAEGNKCAKSGRNAKFCQAYKAANRRLANKIRKMIRQGRQSGFHENLLKDFKRLAREDIRAFKDGFRHTSYNYQDFA